MKSTDRILFQNKHWGSGELLSPPFKRHLFARLWVDLEVRPMVFLTGARRTGKSVLLRQVARDLIINKAISPRQILFFEFAPGDKKETIWEVFHYFQKEVANAKEQRYIFFDEVQFAQDYESVVKEIYDNDLRTKIFLTGSLSLSYKKKMTESLGGRFFSYKLFPVTFQEYLELGNFTELKTYRELLTGDLDTFQRNAHLSQLNAQFRQFLSWGRLPEMIALTEPQNRSYLNSVIGQTLTQDAFNYFSIERPQVIQVLFDYLRENSGGIVAIQSLSQQSGSNNATVSKYLTILELMGLTYVTYNSLNPFAKSNSARKIYVNSAFSLLDTKLDFPTSLGFAAESYVLERLLERGETVTFFRQREWEVDFLLPSKKIAYEVKFRSEIHHLPKAPSGYDLKVISLIGEYPIALF